MNDRVYKLRSDFEIPLEELRDFLDGYEPPSEVDDVEVKQRGKKLMLNAVADRDASNYTPTALLKADVKERRLYDTDEGWSLEKPAPEGFDTDEEETDTKVVKYVCFKGDRETVLQNTALQYPMFEVLADIAKYAGTGELTAVVVVNDELSARRIIEGEDRRAAVEVVDPDEGFKADNTSNWRDNSLIG